MSTELLAAREAIAERDLEIARLQEQLRYEQERNENNVALADRKIARLREAIKGLYETRKILDGKDDWISISFDAAAWDRFAEIAREGR